MQLSATELHQMGNTAALKDVPLPAYTDAYGSKQFSMHYLNRNQITATVIFTIASLLAIYMIRIYNYRLSYRKLCGEMKSPPFSMWFGSIPGIAALYKHSPTDTHPMTTMTVLSQKHNLGPFYFLDCWPATPLRQIMISDPVIAAQAVQQQSPPKSKEYPYFVGHIVGKTSMLLTEGEDWKRARSMFNPGFAAGHLMTLVPSIVDDVLIFANVLSGLAVSGKITLMEDLAARVTIDIMGHVVLAHDLNAQTTENELVNAFRNSVAWSPRTVTTNPFSNMNPFAPLFKAHYSRVSSNYIRKVIQERLAIRAAESTGVNRKDRKRPAIDLAVDEYLLAGQRANVDEKFQQVAIDQMRTFLFAGHDTSSSTVCYIYHLLELHPEALAKVRQEHDEVFGPVGGTADKIKQKPALLNEIPYTLAVIKEVLRLFPPAVGAREGTPEVNLTYNGITYPTANTMIMVNVHTMHRNAVLFPSPESFIPERWLAAPRTWPGQTVIVKDSWRPFEKGPRGCIGQELSILEMKAIMALTLREFDISAVYEEFDRALGREKPGEMLDGKRGMFGYRAYQQMKATAKPCDGMPMRVKKRVV